jgi:hypothetical protein
VRRDGGARYLRVGERGPVDGASVAEGTLKLQGVSTSEVLIFDLI